MRLPRFRIRTLMIAVVVFAVFLARDAEHKRWAPMSREYLTISVEYEAKAERSRLLFDHGHYMKRGATEREARENTIRWIEYCEQLSEKYFQASRRPWLPVPPDPPKPE